MRKMLRLSLMLIAIGIILIPEGYAAYSGEIPASLHDDSMLFLWRGQIVKGNITASAPINFYLMDETNYMAFINGQPWQAISALLNTTNTSVFSVALVSGYYRLVVRLVNPQTENAEVNSSIVFHGIDRDHFDSGLGLIFVGVALSIIVLLNSLRSKGQLRKETRE